MQALLRKENEGKEIDYALLDYEPKLTRSKVKKVVEIEDPVPVSTYHHRCSILDGLLNKVSAD